MAEKTELPTEKRKREAREKGQFARSKSLSSTASAVAGLLAAFAALSNNAGTLVAYARDSLSGATLLRNPAEALHAALLVLASASAPALLASMALGALATAAQVGLNVNFGLIAPKLERLDPSQAWKRMFGPQGLVEALKSLAAVGLALAVAGSALRTHAAELANLASVPGDAAMLSVLGIAGQIAKRAALGLLVLGAADYAWQRRAHLKTLMMTKEEVKQEHKNSEGDPHLKAKRKRMAKELLNAAGKGVRGATAVVVNPTHVAVAVLYDEKVAEAPVIVARGTEAEALKIRLDARRFGVPIVKDVPLARTLVKLDVGEEVPEELYQAVACVLKVVFEQTDAEIAS